MDKKAILSDYIKDEIIRNRNAQLDDNEDLIGTGILDSLGILKLVAHMETSFGIEVPDEDVVYENFHSLNAIAGYLQRHP
jgi:acyl carrier protein